MVNSVVNLDKLTAMAHYIIADRQSSKNFGKTVLFKLLYFSDFNFYKKNLVSISGESYRKIEFGPAPIDFEKVLSKLAKEGDISYEERKTSYDCWKFKSLKDPDLSLFSKAEIETINKVLKKLGHMTAKEISTLSHEDNPCKSSDLNEIINYDLVFYRDEKIEKKVE